MLQIGEEDSGCQAPVDAVDIVINSVSFLFCSVCNPPAKKGGREKLCDSFKSSLY